MRAPRRSRRRPRRTGRRCPSAQAWSRSTSPSRTRSSRAPSTSFRCRCVMRAPHIRATSTGSPPPTSAWPVSKQMSTSVDSRSAGDLRRASRRRGGVMMEDRADAARPAPVGRFVHTFHRPREGVRLESGARLLVRAPGSRHPFRRLGAGEDDRPACAARLERVDDRVEPDCDILGEALGILEPERREAADELEAVSLERRRRRRTVRAEVAGRAELDPGVAETGDGREQLLGRDQVVAIRRALPDAPRHRRARQAVAVHSPPPR